MREKTQNIGLIVAIIVAGVSLPTAIISFSREPTVNNYYTNNYYYNQAYYNQTYYQNNETAPIEGRIDYPLVRYDFISNNSYLGVNKTHIYDAGRDTFLQLVMICNNTECQVLIKMYSLEWYNRGIIFPEVTRTLSGTFTFPIITFPYNTTWLFTFEIRDAFDNGNNVNATIWHQMYYY
ncbi:MAG: hypothetical protein HWN81_12320 [Candidatus Lokiarchaeota archaeon]|nr:hypothetical protein [Candidatus Lokiarchaeota archaeon]